MFILEKIGNDQLKFLGKLGFFLGSFDPIHEGHISVVEEIISENLCDYILVYCVNGRSSYKNRSDFQKRTALCEQKFSKFDNVIISYLSPFELQKKIGIIQNKISNITAILGSDIAIGLENVNPNPEIEKSRKFLQKNFMRGIKIDKNFDDSLACSIILSADNFIVALRENLEKNDIPSTICERNISHIIEIPATKEISSTKIRKRHSSQ